jgi:hypothetical protein
MAADKKQPFEVYKNNTSTGDKKLLTTVNATNKAQALQLAILNGSVKSGNRYLIIPHEIRSKWSVYVGKDEIQKALAKPISKPKKK